MIKSLAILLTFLASLLIPANPGPSLAGQTMLLVRLRPTVTLAEGRGLFQSVEAEIAANIPQLGLVTVAVPSAQVDTALASLEQDEAVVYAEPDARAWAMDAPNDPGWIEQWGLQKINAPLAWRATTGSPDVVVALVDSGVTVNHPDLANQLWVNPAEIPANGVDDDGNGKIDDVWGWHFYLGSDGQSYVPMEDGHVTDDYGHGTHVAGIVGAETNNGIGVAGVAGGSRLMTVKVIDEFGLTWYSLIVQGIVYAVDNGAQVINLSLGGATPSQALQDAVDYAWTHGVVVVAAAGNNGEAVLYPAACGHVLAVAATDVNDHAPSWSNDGPQVDVAAPGADIYSTWPWQDGYWTESGTSMAAPHVSGLASLVRSLQPAWTPAQVTQIITATARDVNVGGWDPYTGWGRIDAGAALSQIVQQRVDLLQNIEPLVQHPGALVTYTISLATGSEMLTDVVISDTLPAEVTVSAASPPAHYDSAHHQLVWGPLTLTTEVAVTATVLVTIDADLAGCPQLTNSVYVFFDGLKLPAVAESSHYVQPCRLYLPLILTSP